MIGYQGGDARHRVPGRDAAITRQLKEERRGGPARSRITLTKRRGRGARHEAIARGLAEARTARSSCGARTVRSRSTRRRTASRRHVHSQDDDRDERERGAGRQRGERVPDVLESAAAAGRSEARRSTDAAPRRCTRSSTETLGRESTARVPQRRRRVRRRRRDPVEDIFEPSPIAREASSERLEHTRAAGLRRHARASAEVIVLEGDRTRWSPRLVDPTRG